MATFERSHTISLFRDPLTGLGQSAPFPYIESQLLRVAGSGFGVKPRQETFFTEDFSGYNNNDVLIDSVWSEYQTNGGAAVTSSLPKLAGKKSAYNNWARGQFATSYMQFPVTDKVFLSYWTRSTNTDIEDYGVLKYCRVNSSTAAGGGGVYNGIGGHALSSGQAKEVSDASPFALYTKSDGSVGLMTPQYQAMPNNQWVRVEYIIHVSDVDALNGLFTVTVEGHSSRTATVMQRTSAKYFQLDTMLLGLDLANPRKWLGVAGSVATSANYSVTIPSLSKTYTVNSGSSPVKTATEIVEALYALISVDLPTTGNGVFMNTAHTELFVGDPNTPITHSFSTNLEYKPYGLAVTDIYLDTDSTSRFYIGDSATYATANKEPQKYLSWSDSNVVLLKYFGNITGTKHLFFVDANESVTYLGVVE